MTRGSFRLIDLLKPEMLRRLVRDGVLPAAAVRDAHARLLEAEAMIAGTGRDQHVTRLDLIILMQDYPGKPPAGTSVAKRRGVYRQRTRQPHAPDD
jgi:hypothetical protein